MKKTLAALAATCLVGVVGCGDKSNPKSKTQDPPPPPGQIEFISDFIYANVSFDLSYYPSQKTMERLDAALTQKGFTIFEIHPTSFKIGGFSEDYETGLKIKPGPGQQQLDLKNVGLGDINAVVFVEITSAPE